MTDLSLEKKILNVIRKRKRQNIFMRSDFENCSSDYDQIGRALKKIVDQGVLLKVGYGLYARAKVSSISGKIVPVETIDVMGRQCLKRLNVKTGPTQAEAEYNSRRSTQVPTGRVIGVRGRISRKIGYGGVTIKFEKIRKKMA